MSEYNFREMMFHLTRAVLFHTSVVQTRASCSVFYLGSLFSCLSDARAVFPDPLLVVPPTY